MSRLATISYWGNGMGDMEIVGSTAYVATGAAGLHILDLMNPEEPVEVGYRDGTVLDVCVSGNRAYTTSGMGGVVWDITNPMQPQELGRWNIGYDFIAFWEIFVHGNIGIVTDEDYHTRVIDVSDPQNVHHIGDTWFGPRYMKPIGMAGEYFVLIGYDVSGGLRIYDLSNPELPVLVAAIDTSFRTDDAVISGSYAFLANSSTGLRIYDISNPLEPTFVGACDTTGYARRKIIVTGEHAVMTKRVPVNEYYVWNMDVWNVSLPTCPVLESSLPMAECGKPSSVGSYVYVPTVTSSAAGTIFDIANPASPTEIGVYGNHSHLCKLAINGTSAYVADSRVGLRVTDITNPNNPLEVGHSEVDSLDTYHGVSDVAVRGDFAYLLADDRKLFVADLHDPAQPQLSLVWTTDFPANLSGIVVYGDYAYVGDAYRQRIHTFSLADSALPVWVDSLALPGGAYSPLDLALYNGYLCVVFSDGFHVLSLENPAAPQLIGSLNEEIVGVDLSIAGDYAYVASEILIRVIDLSNPAQPALTGQIPAAGDCRAVAASGNILIASETYGLRAWDISNPLNPQMVGYYTRVTEFENIEWTEDIAVLGSHILTTSNQRFRVYACDALLETTPHPEAVHSPEEFRLHPCYPNPFNPTTTISFTLPRASRVTLSIFSLLGQSVYESDLGKLEAGEHRHLFDGSDLPSGVYLARVEAAGTVQMKKMVLLK